MGRWWKLTAAGPRAGACPLRRFGGTGRRKMLRLQADTHLPHEQRPAACVCVAQPGAHAGKWRIRARGAKAGLRGKGEASGREDGGIGGLAGLGIWKFGDTLPCLGARERIPKGGHACAASGARGRRKQAARSARKKVRFSAPPPAFPGSRHPSMLPSTPPPSRSRGLPRTPHLPRRPSPLPTHAAIRPALRIRPIPSHPI